MLPPCFTPNFAVVFAGTWICELSLVASPCRHMNSQLRFVDKIFLTIGSMGPLGHLPASGTFTVAIIGIPIYWMSSLLSSSTYLAVAAALTVFSILIHDVGDRILGTKDSPVLVWDELVGFFIAVYGLSFTWPLAIIAFLLERALDIAKIPPANWIERRWPGGLGVVGDDVIAGLYSCALIHGLVYFLPLLAT
ncbi:MAG: phosphatidylglycerophosphatase A [Planctomycetes bacterium]|nr:phosphatidylglycerophosphatase A [Planctomycetota bacterium]MBI3834705.1 phosphatidylglycerophosphatase A [Planctomycetota bacterium]